MMALVVGAGVGMFIYSLVGLCFQVAKAQFEAQRALSRVEELEKRIKILERDAGIENAWFERAGNGG